MQLAIVTAPVLLGADREELRSGCKRFDSEWVVRSLKGKTK